MKEIFLTDGKVAQVSEEDFVFLVYWSWTTLQGPYTSYAARGERTSGIYSKILMHRVVAERKGLVIEELEIDHIDRNGLNNQRGNLRVGTKSQNQHNTFARTDSSSGHRGVKFNKREGKWKADIQIRGRRFSLGTFATFEEALQARLKAEEKI